MLTLCTAFNAHLDNLFLLLYADGPWFGLTLYAAVSLLVHRFANNYTNRVGCGFECAGKKTQA